MKVCHEKSEIKALKTSKSTRLTFQPVRMKQSTLVLLPLVFFVSSLCEMPSCFENCPANEVYSRCGAGLCESNCWKQVEKGCPCTPGCVCQSGFIRDPNTYQCIPKEKCPLIRPGQCPAFEEWSDSLAGCQKSCYTMKEPTPKCFPVPGCVCKQGFIRCSIFGQCIPLASCLSCPPGYAKDLRTFHCNFCCQECRENEEYIECATSCEPHCPNKTAIIKPCNLLPCKPGCFCKNGYVRDDVSRKCIPKEWCKGINHNS